MRKAKIENGIITNIIVVDPDNIPDWCAAWPDATDDYQIGKLEGVAPTQEELDAAAAVELEVARASMTLTFAELMIGLVTEAWITEAEGEAWLAGTLPFAVLTVIDGLPEGQRFAAKARALRPSEVLRADPLVIAMGTAAGKTAEQIDQFFQTHAQV